MPYRDDLPVPVNEYDARQAFFDAQTHLRHTPASLPVSNSTRSFWLHPSEKVNPLAKEGSNGPLTSDADICIIGSGITGVSAAYHLSKMVSGAKIVILEARDFCSGATGRNGGHLTAWRFMDFSQHQKTIGTEEAIKQFMLEHRTVSSLLDIIKSNALENDIDFVSGGHFDLLFTEEEEIAAKADFKRAKEAGTPGLEEVKWYSKEEMKETYGTSYPAVHIPGHNLWPLKLVTNLFHMAKTQLSSLPGSLALHTSTPVTTITSTSRSGSDRRWTLTTPRGLITCTSVLHATNGYASALLPALAGPQGIVPVRGQILATRAAASLQTISRSSWSGNEGYEYWFPRPPVAGREVEDAAHPLVIIGGGREVVNDELGEADDSVVSAEVGTAVRKFLPAVFPGRFEVGAEPEMEWTGIMGFTSTHDPFVGPVPDTQSKIGELAGQYIAAGFSGHGMPRTFSCAEAIASLIAHDLADMPREKWEAPAWLPQRFLTWNRVVQ
ncbi:DAO-domain-containing protein [Phellopilus nigrolimitatus]|nr:DAO-domain-containing protein [Phellopilus nigrolimitatus]